MCVYYLVDYYDFKEIGTSHITLILINVRSDFLLIKLIHNLFLSVHIKLPQMKSYCFSSLQI